MGVILRIDRPEAEMAAAVANIDVGEEVILVRAGEPIARITPIAHTDKTEVDKVIAEIIAGRKGRPSTKTDEIVAWRNEGRRF